jgi:hypothetical protein
MAHLKIRNSMTEHAKYHLGVVFVMLRKTTTDRRLLTNRKSDRHVRKLWCKHAALGWVL